jgi:hypothetical protein
MRPQRSWPTVYRVKLRAVSAQPEEYKVLTWLYEEKAILLAGEAFVRTHGCSAYDGEVEELGPADANEDGTVDIPPGTLGDRMEF